MVRKTSPKLIPEKTTPLNVTSTDHKTGYLKPIQFRIDSVLHREIKAYAAEQGKSITALLLEAYQLYRQINN
jgi:predicted HicB family RNase H-like nuclease